MKILIAEDDPSLRKVLFTLLEKSGYCVDAVSNGQDALDYLRIGCYEAAILDIMMPRIDGLQVLSTIRREKNSTPVLMLTAKSEIDDKVTGLDTGSHRLSAPGGSYQLANKEYQAMLLLMRNPRISLSPNQFLENIWDPDSRAESNTVWTYISYLRRKLSAIDSDLQITTHRSSGYCLEEKR